MAGALLFTRRTQKALPTGGLFNMAVSFYALFLCASRELANFFDHEPDT